MSQQRKPSESNIYHTIERGVGGQIIFEDDEDRRCYLRLLRRELSKGDGRLLAWCLMDNHVHLLLQMRMESLSRFMQGLHGVYAAYFNERHQREGHLFQGKFKSEPVNDDRYFLTVLRYIHQNPMKAGMAKDCWYRWSSYREYVDEPRITSTGFALDIIGGKEQFVSFHQADAKATGVLEAFKASNRLNDEHALALANEVLGRHPGTLRAEARAIRNRDIRRLRDCGLTLRQIHRLTGISLSVISDCCSKR